MALTWLHRHYIDPRKMVLRCNDLAKMLVRWSRCKKHQQLLGSLDHFSCFPSIWKNSCHWLSLVSEGWFNHQPDTPLTDGWSPSLLRSDHRRNATWAARTIRPLSCWSVPWDLRGDPDWPPELPGETEKGGSLGVPWGSINGGTPNAWIVME